MHISARARAIDTSGIRKVFDLAAGMKDPINLSIGQPSFDAFEEMKQAVQRAVESGKSRYTVTQGIPELREAIRAQHALSSLESEVIVTLGVSGGFTLTYMAVLDPGDEVLIPDPFFGMYRDVALLLNARPVFYDMYPNFHLPLEQIEGSITSRTRAIVVNTPGNPTGVSLMAEEIDGLLEIARRRDLWVIYDEIYSFFSYDNPHVSVLGRHEKTVVLNGFAKSHGVPGWRIGYAIGPREIIQEMTKMQQYTFICAPSLVQWGALAGLGVDATATLADYRRKRDMLYEGLRDKYELAKPTGAFYAFPRVPQGSGQEFFERCLKSNLLLIPGNVFSRQDTNFRVSFSAAEGVLERGIEVLRKLA